MLRSALLGSILGLAAAAAAPTFAQDGPKPTGDAGANADAETAYTRALEKRAGDVLDVLKLEDPAKAARVREAVIAQYRGLRKLHDARDANIKSFRDRPHTDQSELDGRIRAERERTNAAA